MRTRKLRFLSALLAVAMMFMLTPTAAFADTVIGDVEFGENDLPKKYNEAQNPANPYNSGDGWSVQKSGNTTYFDIKSGYVYNPAGIVPAKSIRNYGTIASGTFTGTVYNFSKITAGTFTWVMGRDNSVVGGDTSNQPIIENYTSQGSSKFNGGIVYGTLSQSSGEINGGIFAGDPSKLAKRSPHTVTAPNCTICGVIKLTDAKPRAWVVGEENVVVRAPKKKFLEWSVTGIDLANAQQGEETVDSVTYKTLTFTMPADCDVTVTAVKVKTPLTIENGVPVDEDGPYAGDLPNDGWSYTERSSTLTVGENFTADLDKNTVQWKITNNGTLQNGTIQNAITNNGIVKDIVATSYFYNYGKIESGVFSRAAALGDQSDAVQWVSVNGGKVCGMRMAGVVGTQTVTVEANASANTPFEGWAYSGDVTPEIAEQIEKQKNNETMTLDLNGSDGGTIVLTAKNCTDAFALTMLDGKASVNGTNVTAAVPGQTVTLTLDDSEIPEGMSFDHWVISPDVELEGDFKATDRTTSFTMPAQELTIYASLRTDSDDGMDMATVVAGVAVGAGVAYLGYQVGTELYAEQILGKGVAIPRTRADVALTAWKLAGKPEVAIEGEPLSEAAQAQKWAVESGLMQNDADGSFNPEKKMSKLKALKVLDAAKKMG